MFAFIIVYWIYLLSINMYSRWVIRYSNGVIKVTGNRHLDNTWIFIMECVALRDSVLTATHNDFINLDIEGDSKVIIDYCNKKSILFSSIGQLMEDNWRLY